MIEGRCPPPQHTTSTRPRGGRGEVLRSQLALSHWPFWGQEGGGCGPRLVSDLPICASFGFSVCYTEQGGGQKNIRGAGGGWTESRQTDREVRPLCPFTTLCPQHRAPEGRWCSPPPWAGGGEYLDDGGELEFIDGVGDPPLQVPRRRVDQHHRRRAQGRWPLGAGGSWCCASGWVRSQRGKR